MAAKVPASHDCLAGALPRRTTIEFSRQGAYIKIEQKMGVMNFQRILDENPWVYEVMSGLNDGEIVEATVETSDWTDTAFDEDEFMELVKSAIREGLSFRIYASDGAGRRGFGDG